MFEKQNVNKRSPLKNYPLRQPGQSLNEEIQNIFYDKILWSGMIIFVLFSLTLFEWIRKYFNKPPQPIAWTSFFIIVTIYLVIKNAKYIKEIKNLRQGRDGERNIGNFLEELRTKGYKVYHDIINERFNIDHILVGPGGVFTIETKTISKIKGKNSQISFDGVNLKIDGFTPDRDPIVQAMSQKYWLENFIEINTNTKIKVRPVIIYPGWYVNQKASDSEVWVLNEKALSSFLENEGVVLSVDQINLISSHLESYNRN